jgi:hypothetical protein
MSLHIPFSTKCAKIWILKLRTVMTLLKKYAKTRRSAKRTDMDKIKKCATLLAFTNETCWRFVKRAHSRPHADDGLLMR